MSLANLQVFNQYAYSTMQEMLSYNVNLFNQATRGGLILTSSSNQGDYSDEAMYKRIAGLIRRRDAYGSGSVSAVDLEHLLKTSVKVAAGTPPVNIDPGWWQWIQRSPEEAGVVLGKQLAEDTLSDMVSVAIKAYVAAVSNVGSDIVYDGTAATMSLLALNNTARKFGDRSQDILCWIINSQPMFDLFGAALTNTEQLFTFGTVNIRTDPMGRPFIITDQPDLVYTSGGTKYHTLGLASGGVIVEQNPDFLENVETNNGDENIKRTYQAQWSYNVGLKGFAWDKNNGGHSPTNAALATGTNWDQYAASIKDLSGVMANTQ